MIVQQAPAGAEHFVITMDQHTALARQFAAHYGNADFEAISPRAQMLEMVGNHDAGWRELDQAALRDPATGLPFNLVQTPFGEIIKTSSLSPDRSGEFHAYCELLSSMHSWGLYNGRYGMSDKVLLDALADSNRAAADTMLEHEAARQRRLKNELRQNPATATWVDDAHLFQNYKQLQFFDTLALYFNCTPASDRGTTTFSHVPLNAADDTSVTIEPVSENSYQITPCPFDHDEIEFSFSGRYMTPVAAGDDVRKQFDAAPLATQSFWLLR